MKQVVVIHGGGAFATYEEFLSALKATEIDDPGIARGKGWKADLQEKFGPEYQVILPQMPNKQNAKYQEWKIWFEKYIPYINDRVILVGHSLGGSFLAKYLSQEHFPKKIAATLFIAAPFDSNGHRDMAEFAVPDSLNLLATQGGNLLFYHSNDDTVVPFSELAKYQAALPQATARTFTDRGHFNQDEFPELVADIKSITA